MKVRKATETDLPKVVELGAEFHKQTQHSKFSEYDSERVGEFLKAAMGSTHSAVFVATLDSGEVVGMAGAMLFPLWLNPSHLTGQELFWYVDPEHRKSKAGKLLFTAVEAWAKDSGAQSFCMASIASPSEARVCQIYESKGYAPLERSFIKAL